MTVLQDYLEGQLSAPLALMRLLLEGRSAEEVTALLASACRADRRLEPLHRLAQERQEGLRTLEHMVRAGADHAEHPDAATTLAGNRAMFDRLVGISAEASVAAYSLADPALLAAATAELVTWLRESGLLAARPDILDLGCGIGRLTAALASEAGSALGIDLSPAMVEAARARHPGLHFETCDGGDLSGLADRSFDLVLAVDVFPYIVQGGLDLASRMVSDAARVLRAGGTLLVLNFSYRGAELDRRDMPGLAAACGFAVEQNGVRAFTLWDGLVFRLRRLPAP